MVDEIKTPVEIFNGLRIIREVRQRLKVRAARCMKEANDHLDHEELYMAVTMLDQAKEYICAYRQHMENEND